ncbi:hypothetical protein KJ708_07150, partial [bacterium]|nr:hypothetical protein [bacterium]MBU1918945.1 hypothetical protein [bacterium]
AAAAVSVSTITSTDTVSAVNDSQLTQVMAVGNAGFAYASNQINNGYCPKIANKDIGPGKFSIDTDPIFRTVTVESEVGKAKKVLRMNMLFATDCVGFSCVYCYAEEETGFLRNAQYTKSCNNQAIVSKMYVTWDSSTCALNTNCDGTSSNSGSPVLEDVGDPPNGKIWICHVPPGNPDNAHTIHVSPNSWNGHKNHDGDYNGPCLKQTNETVTTCDATTVSEDALANCMEESSINHVIDIDLANTSIFGSSGDYPTESGEETDVADSVLSANGIYVMDIGFDELPPAGSWVTIVTEYADGSVSKDKIKIGTEPGTPGDSENLGFNVLNGKLIVDDNYRLDYEVLGSAMTCGSGGSEINVRAKLCLNDNCSELWGYDDLDGGETHSVNNTADGNEYRVQANAYSTICSNFTQTTDSTNTVQVKTLIDGQPYPPLDGFGGQMGVQDFLQNYIDDDGNVVLENNQVIMLFEMGIDLSNGDNDAADFQDLVLLTTITPN